MQEKGLEVLLLLFLGRETGRDLRKRQISVPAAGMGALAAVGIRLFGAQIARETATLSAAPGGLCIDLIPGVLLLLAAFATREAIGYGDGLVLLVCGLCVGFWETAALLMLALMLLVPVSLGLLLSRRGNRKTELPFLPFLLAAWMIRLVLRM